MISLKHYEDAVIHAQREYYAARRNSMRHPNSERLELCAKQKRSIALERHRQLQAVQNERGVKL